jgi:demethylmenaquinone methyltransferase/2-methoxy-6-polyprenyl-1,4-benzoquinol methylase
MSSLALMRFLESAPERYDAGMRLLTLGRVGRLHDALAAAAAPAPGARVLEIGCGTGSLTALLAARGARVTALDQNPEMLERARARLRSAGEAVTWLERTASEIDALPAAGFDAVVLSLSLSEMSTSERGFVLRESLRRLAAGGILAAGDEVRPRRRLQRLMRALFAAPQILLAWLAVGSTSRPLHDLRAEVQEAGFRVRSERRWLLGTLSVVVAEAP